MTSPQKSKLKPSYFQDATVPELAGYALAGAGRVDASPGCTAAGDAAAGKGPAGRLRVRGKPPACGAAIRCEPAAGGGRVGRRDRFDNLGRTGCLGEDHPLGPSVNV